MPDVGDILLLNHVKSEVKRCCSILCPGGGGSADMLDSALCSAEEEANRRS